MKTTIDVVDGAAQHHRVGDVAFDKFDAARQVFHAPMRQIVEHAHDMSARHKVSARCEPMNPHPPVMRKSRRAAVVSGR